MKQKLLLLIIMTSFIINYSSAQKWEKTQPFTLYAVDKDKTLDSVKVGIGTSTPHFPLEVKGKIVADSIHIHGSLQIGDSTFSFVPNVLPFPLSDHIRSENGIIALMAGDNTTFTPNIQVGIGLTNPGSLMTLDVLNRINTRPSPGNSPFAGYCISERLILKAFNVGCIFVGEGAGSNGALNVGNYNTYTGFISGMANTSGGNNAFYGAFSGVSNTSGWHNAFYGTESGTLNTLGTANTFIGDNSGLNNSTGSNNTYIGNFAQGSAAINNSTAIGATAIAERIIK